MRKLYLFLFLCLCPLLAIGESEDFFNAVAVSGITLPAATKSYTFTSGSLSGDFTFTRSSAAWYFNSSGNLASATTNTPRFDYSFPSSAPCLLIEHTVINQALQARDLTQAVWIKTTATAALNQTGTDAAANSASSLTATAANATALQTVTQSATTSQYSVYLKRITGTGTISITQDGGTTYTPVTLTSSWQRFYPTSQSTLNPSFGIKISTSGDAIGVDVNQFEAGATPTSPIITTTATVTRQQDNAVNSSIPWFNATTGSAVVSYIPEAVGNIGRAFNFSDGTTSNGIEAFNNTSTTTTISPEVQISVSGTGKTSAPANLTIGALSFLGLSYVSGNNIFVANSTSITTNTYGTSTIPSGINKLVIGNRADGGRPNDGCYKAFSYWNTYLTAAQLKKAER